jgi:hypothetical protein
MRKLNDMYHLEGEQLVKTSNNQIVPEDEPLFILRGRDSLAALGIMTYRRECMELGVPEDRIKQLDQVILKFQAYAKNHTVKLPGITHGM